MKIKEMIKELANRYMLRGFATLAEKAHLATMVKDLSDEDKGEVKDTVAAADSLPEVKPEDEDEDKDDDADADKGASPEEVEKMVNAAVVKAMADHKELSEKRAGVYNEKIAVDRVAINKRAKEFIGALRFNDTVKLKDMTTTDAAGGYAVDSELAAEIQHLTTQYGVARREMFFTFVDKGDIRINNLTTDVTVYWTDEAAAKTSTGAVIGQVTLVLKKLAAIIPLSDELIEDSEVDYAAFLSERIAEAMAKEEDAQFFDGDGTVFTGILRNASVNTVTMTGTTFASIDGDDLIDMQDATPGGALANAKYFMNRTILSYVRKLKSSETGIYLYQPLAQGSPSSLCGYPLVIVEAMPGSGDTAVSKAFVLFGDLRKACWFGAKRSGLSVYLAKEGTVRNTAANADIELLRQDMQALRFVERVGYIAPVPKAVTRLRTAASSA